jgi:glyoxylase-like metal-dependent hydrolase (beta-lactamase superfamily II)
MAGARAIYAFHTGIIDAPRGLFVDGRRGLEALSPVPLPILCFAVELARGGWLLVDAGIASASRFPVRVEPEWTYERRLAALGITRGDVRAALVTHLDYDHTGGLPYLAPVTTYVSAAEWRHGCEPTLRERLTGRLRPRDYGGLQRVREAPLGDAAGEPWTGRTTFEIEESDGAAALLPLPGHTVGHAGVLVRLAGGGRVLLSGDACYAAAQVEDGVPPTALARAVAWDAAEAGRTLLAIRRWRALDRDLRVVPSHDPPTGDRCAAGPARIA